jgi:site-specific DNA-methyltransferase (adenine-specific)
MTDKKYNIIYADPPWSYEVMKSVKKEHGTALSHYPTMTIEEITALPINKIADKDCALFLWATYPKLNEILLSMAK